MAQKFRRISFANPLRRGARPGLIAGDERGVTLVEFGLFFPILALMVLGTIDLARGLTVKFALEQASQRTIELATLGSTRARDDYTFLRTEAATAAGVPIAQVTLDQWLECRSATGTVTRAATFTGTCPSAEQPARYVKITIYRDFTPNFRSIPFVGSLATRTDGTIRLTADSGVRVQ